MHTRRKEMKSVPGAELIARVIEHAKVRSE
jgi:hypothetical protein